ncbi:low temperature requirement protein A [uncultured Friedmanniella sp.]|uniref:low temperature requirement protein A n=1 Tax=uncultured Friedmanniella sp. TaxID=335381 RepID=UPI0035C9F057
MSTAVPGLVRRLLPRDPHEEHRVASPLELLTDLCFVVAIASAADEFHHAVSTHHAAQGALGFAMAFFAIWWAWLNFTWFGSAYDNDDVVYRLLTILQIVGVLVLAAGIPAVFEGEVTVVVIGYVVMRVGLVLQWLRAARHDPGHRRTALRYAAGIVVVQLAWISYIWVAEVEVLRVPCFVLLALADMAVPVWAERTGMTTWHPHHIAERYSLFFIIVLGETVLSASTAVSTALTEQADRAGVAVVAASSVLIVFGCWWLYFSRDVADVLDRAAERQVWVSYGWGFGHYVVFASAAMTGAGLAGRVDHWTRHSESSALVSAASVTVPVAVLVASIWLVQLGRDEASGRTGLRFSVAAVLILAGTFSPLPELVAGLVVAGLLVLQVRAGRPGQTPAAAGLT